MKLTKWTDEEFAPVYLTQGNIFYERVFIDVDTMSDGFAKIPITSDVSYFFIMYKQKKCSVHENAECQTGCFFAPFVECNSKEELVNLIGAFVYSSGSYLQSKQKTSFPCIKVIVYRYKAPDGKRFFAIGGTNLHKKNKAIQDLRVKTPINEPLPPNSIELWEAVLLEMGVFENKVHSCEVVKEEILPFESKNISIPKECNDVLILLPKGDFFAQHFIGQTNKKYEKQSDYVAKIMPGATKKSGSTFKLKTVQFSSMSELNLSIKLMIETFRSLTGASRVKATVLYSEQDGILSGSIACTKPETLIKEDEEEE